MARKLSYYDVKSIRKLNLHVVSLYIWKLEMIPDLWKLFRLEYNDLSLFLNNYRTLTRREQRLTSLSRLAS